MGLFDSYDQDIRETIQETKKLLYESSVIEESKIDCNIDAAMDLVGLNALSCILVISIR